MPKIRAKHIGSIHAHLGDFYTGIYNEFIDNHRSVGRLESGLRYLPYHRDWQGRFSESSEILFELMGDETFRRTQREVLQRSSDTLSALSRLAHSSVFHDNLVHLVEAVDWYGVEDEVSQKGLAGWFEAHQGNQTSKLKGICERVRADGLGHLLMALRAYETWLDGRDIPEVCSDFLKADPPEVVSPFLELAAAVLRRTEGSPLASLPWVVETRAQVKLTLPIQPEILLPESEVSPDDDWYTWAAAHILNNETVELPALLEQCLLEDRGRLVSTLLVHLDGLALSEDTVHRLSALLIGLTEVEFSDGSLRDLLCSMGANTAQQLLSNGFDVTNWLLKMLSGHDSDQQRLLSGAIRHLVGLHCTTGPNFECVDIVLNFIDGIESAKVRPAVAASIPRILTLLVDDTGVPVDLDQYVSRLVTYIAAAVPNVTSDYMLFGLGRALGRLGEGDAVHKAFAKVKHPWIKGQLLRVQPPAQMAKLKLLPLLPQLEWPLAHLFSFMAVFRACGPTCTTDEFLEGVQLATRFGDHAEIRVAALETLLEASLDREDRSKFFGRLWDVHGGVLAELPDRSFEWRIVYAVASANTLRDEMPMEMWSWIETKLQDVSDPERHALVATRIAQDWQITERSLATPGASKDNHENSPHRLLEELMQQKAKWSPDEWVSQLNSIAVRWPDWLEALGEALAARLLGIIGPSFPTTISIRLILELSSLSQIEESDWPSEHQEAQRLAQAPETFSPDWKGAFAGEGFWATVVRWMVEHPTRSDVIANHFTDPQVHETVAEWRKEVFQSEYGRVRPIVSQPCRKLLMYLTTEFLSTVRPSQILAAELLYRCTQGDELGQLRDRWLAEETS